MRFRADTREHQQLRRVDRATAKDDFPVAANLKILSFEPVDSAHGPSLFDQNPARERMRDDRQIRPTFDWPQIAHGGTAAAALVHRSLIKAHTFLPGPVEIGIARYPEHYRRLDKPVPDLALVGPIRYRQRTTRGMELVGTARLVLDLQEIGEQGFPVPARGTTLFPAVVVVGLAPDVNHAIDAA
jgi:hypothetical protein